MAQIQGTPVTAPIVPHDDQCTYPTHLSEFGKGGLKTIDTQANVFQKVPKSMREEGMLVYCESEGVYLTLRGGIEDLNWVSLNMGATQPPILFENEEYYVNWSSGISGDGTSANPFNSILNAINTIRSFKRGIKFKVSGTCNSVDTVRVPCTIELAAGASTSGNQLHIESNVTIQPWGDNYDIILYIGNALTSVICILDRFQLTQTFKRVQVTEQSIFYYNDIITTSTQSVISGVAIVKDFVPEPAVFGVWIKGGGVFEPTKIATDTQIGSVKVGSGLSITIDGTLSATGSGGGVTSLYKTIDVDASVATSGDGTTTPVKTIAEALALMTDTNIKYTIRVFAGTYNETCAFTNPAILFIRETCTIANIIMEGDGESSISVYSTATLTVSGGITFGSGEGAATYADIYHDTNIAIAGNLTVNETAIVRCNSSVAIITANALHVKGTLYTRQDITGTKTITGQYFVGTGNFTPQQIASTTQLGNVKVGTGLTIGFDGTLSADAPIIPTATTSNLGVVSIGDRLTVNGGHLSATVQSDNNFTDAYRDYIRNIGAGDLYIDNVSGTDLSSTTGSSSDPFKTHNYIISKSLYLYPSVIFVSDYSSPSLILKEGERAFFNNNLTVTSSYIAFSGYIAYSALTISSDLILQSPFKGLVVTLHGPSLIINGDCTIYTQVNCLGDITVNGNLILNNVLFVRNLSVSGTISYNSYGKVITGYGKLDLPVSSGGTSYTLPPATLTTLGGVIVGETLNIDASGTLNKNAVTQGLTYYVNSVSGSNANAGTYNSPFATIMYALSVAKGDCPIINITSTSENITINRKCIIQYGSNVTVGNIVINNEVYFSALTPLTCSSLQLNLPNSECYSPKVSAEFRNSLIIVGDCITGVGTELIVWYALTIQGNADFIQGRLSIGEWGSSSLTIQNFQYLFGTVYTAKILSSEALAQAESISTRDRLCFYPD